MTISILVILVILALCLYFFCVFTSSDYRLEGFSSKLAIKDLPPRLKWMMTQELDNKWGFVPVSPTLTGNSQTKTYADIYAYYDPNFNYTDYWNYSYPLLVYPRRGFTDYRSFGHPLYSFGSKSLTSLGAGIN